MKVCIKIRLLLILLFFLIVHIVYPQTDQYKFESVTSLDGLSGNRIYAILQDSRDFVWIGTNRGLNCYNGYEIKLFDRLRDPLPLSENSISCLFEDLNGMLWIGTTDKGLYVYNHAEDRFKHYSATIEDSLGISSNSILSIYQDRTGVIWIATNGDGLNRFNAETKTFTAFRPVSEKDGHNKNTISSMLEDDDGTFWVGTYEGIFNFDRIKEVFIPVEKELDIKEIYQQIFCIQQDADENIWIGTLKGLFKYVKNEKKLFQIISRGNIKNDNLKDDVIVSIRVSNISDKHILWIATRNGLVRFDVENDSFVRFTIDPVRPESLSNNSINALHLNDESILWIGTAWSGVNKINTNSNSFKHVLLKSENDSLYYSTSSFYMDKMGCLWVGACEGGLFRFDPEMKKIGQYQYSSEKGFFIDVGTPFTNFVDFVYEDSNGNIWFGAGGWGPVIFDKEKEKFIYIDFALPEGFTRPERVQSILEDLFGTIWVGTDRGLFKKNKDEDIISPLKIIDNQLLQRESILTMYKNSREDLYFGVRRGGVFCLKKTDNRDNLFRVPIYKNSDNSEELNTSVNDFHEDINGALWAALSNGLTKLNPEAQRFEFVSDTTGTFGEGVLQIFGDKKGSLWLSHRTKGLLRYQPYKKSIKVFDINDGLPFNNIVPRYWYQSNDGRIFIPAYLGDGNGFFYFHPDSIIDNKAIPQVIVTDFKVNNQAFSTDSSIGEIKQIRLKYNQNFFSFQFAALDYTNSNKNQYAYYLQGLEDDWNYSGSRRFANYTGVPPGNYIFRAKGSNNDGYWNEAGTSIAITVLPPPWKTWWAYTFYGIFLIGLIYLWRSYYLKSQRLKLELEIEHVEAEKLKELDKMKSQFFANISHEFRTPLTLILGPLEKMRKQGGEKAKKDMDLIQRNALRLQSLINQLLNLSKLESGKMRLLAREENIVSLINRYVQSFESLAKQKNIDLQLKSDKEKILLFIDKDKIEKILYNLLSNAFKFTEDGGKIKITITSSGPSSSEVIITISDTGLGIPPDKLPHIFDRFYQVDDSYTKDQEGTGIGLALTKELVKLHHGTIKAVSHPGEGSVFTILLSAGKIHLTADEIADKSEISAEPEKNQESFTEDEFLDLPVTGEDIPNPIEFNEMDDKPNILIVDDNADLRSYIRECLNDDYYILEAREGMEGFGKAIERVPNLIVSDVMMPKMDGYELCRKLKMDERTSHIPVILLTARASSKSRIEGLETGADDFITKPFDQQELLVRIKNLIQQRSRLKEKFKTEIEFSQFAKDSDGQSMDQQFIIKAKAVVADNISASDFSVENFAEEMALSRVQLHRKLRALVDQSASQFIRTIKLNRAAELLMKQGGTVSEIAYDVGFNTLPYFTKCFHEQFGVNPSEFANKKH